MTGGMVSVRPSSNAMTVAEVLPLSLLQLPTTSLHLMEREAAAGWRPSRAGRQDF
jgi:hypothetical protein